MKKFISKAIGLGLTLAASAIGETLAEPIGYSFKMILCPVFRQAEEEAAREYNENKKQAV